MTRDPSANKKNKNNIESYFFFSVYSIKLMKSYIPKVTSLFSNFSRENHQLHIDKCAKPARRPA